MLNLIKKIIYKLSLMKPKDKTPKAAEAPAAKKAGGSSADIFTQNKKQHLRDLESKAREKENE